jgi:arginyl-tRNA synthetase
MMDIYNLLKSQVTSIISEIYNVSIPIDDISIEQTNEDFTGDFTVIVFPLSKIVRRSPVEVASQLSEKLLERIPELESTEVIKGFLNLTMKKAFWLKIFKDIILGDAFIKFDKRNELFMVEFSSPNTNKPLHLGHIRNNLLGNSISQLLAFHGYQVIKNNLINDRGIHICKSMLAWIKFGNNETPASSGIKGDHLVGKYYVLFDQKYKEEIARLVDEGMEADKAANNSELMQETRLLLQKWEENDPEVKKVWQTMNNWAYEGFDITYDRMGIRFDKIYYESETYLKGKEIVKEGLEKGIFYSKEDGSIWVDLSNDGMDEKLLLRPDGTSVYITQDIGTAEIKYHDFKPDRSLYVVGDEQEYHFKVLKLILEKLGKPYAQGLYHLAYGMVDLPEGRMKSREGKVVDADDLMEEMHQSVKEFIKESGKWEESDDNEIDSISETIGIGALKFFILRTNARKRIIFNPEESIDLQGFTGPFVQYTYARIKSVLRKGLIDAHKQYDFSADVTLSRNEQELINKLYHFRVVLNQSMNELDPSLIAIYVFQLAKMFNQFYHDLPILKEENMNNKNFRISLSVRVAEIIRISLHLLGIEVSEKM